MVFITIKMVFSEKFPKNCVFEVFYCFCKNDHLISKTGLPLFFTTKPTYSLNLVKNGKAVWSESLVEVAALDRKQKWTITLQWRLVFATKINTFATRLSFALHYFASLGRAQFPVEEFLLAAARCPSGNWNTFATEKITLQTNCETDFSKMNVLEVYFCRREESLYRCHSLQC